MSRAIFLAFQRLTQSKWSHNKRWLIILTLVMTTGTGLFTFACQSSVYPSPPAGATFGQLAGRGTAAFANRCARCHGARGQAAIGPALIGEAAHLHHFDDAEKLLGYINTTMPKNAPGSLSEYQYNDVICFLLCENELVERDKVFASTELASIHLEIEAEGHSE